MRLFYKMFSNFNIHIFRLGFVFMTLIILAECGGKSKYSAEANTQPTKPAKVDLSYFRNLQKPFRMAKINMLWAKAQLRLTEPKLQSLFSELKIHDKEELTWKKLRNEGGDKDGLKEAEMRKKLIGIMSTYDLLEHFEDVNDPVKVKDHRSYDGNSDDHLNKLVFKDKKLNKLWLKAERSGFTAAELKTLHEEFTHHQDKIDQYQSLIGEDDKDKAKNAVEEDLDAFNELEKIDDKKEQSYHGKANKLREQHKEIRDGYDRLHRLAAQGPANKEFVEPKVQGLWRIATQANFTAHELESLRVELMHYENRLLKLRHLQAEAQMNSDKYKKSEGKPSEAELLHMDKIKKQARKAEKLHYDLESRIMQKHVEL